ncbi:hypothetical protein DPMN_068672 [Dreissena polymorpha]|uniref:Uncharacterized protein n=1 Tax=Dreissena polymorpha TaxID=45954 RepID=A0A9D3Z227_DREPO|nr:hypothetical protein DPMN_068672 [Dreissena polymorpha]
MLTVTEALGGTGVLLRVQSGGPERAAEQDERALVPEGFFPGVRALPQGTK